MERHERIIAIAQTLPGIESFLKEVLGNEPLSSEAERQRLEFLRRLESISLPPSLPPRPPDLGLRRRQALRQESSLTGSQSDESAYKNESFDPVDFASKQRDLSRTRTYSTRREFNVNESAGGQVETLVAESRNSISSYEDDIYEHLLCDTKASSSPPVAESPQWSSGGTLRSSGGKGKLWFTKREAKNPSEVHASDLLNPSIKGFLKEVKTNKRRWCVIHNQQFYIFKNSEDPAIQIIDLPSCEIGVDDKKKISYSFKLSAAGSPPVSLAIEDGQDLSPWMSAIMAAAVYRGTGFRPTSPLENAFPLRQPSDKDTFVVRERKTSEVDMEEEESSALESYYECPSDVLSESPSPRKFRSHSTPVNPRLSMESTDGYFAPLPPLPIESVATVDVASSSDSSDDEYDEEEEDDDDDGTEDDKKGKKEKIYDEIPEDLLKELTQERQRVASEELPQENSSSLGDESHSEHSTTASNRHSFTDMLHSDDTGTGSSQGESCRKRASTALSTGSVDSDTETSKTERNASFPKPLAPKIKRRRKQPPIRETRLKFFQDSAASYCGVLYQRRNQNVWSKRYCKIVETRLRGFRHPGDEQPCLDVAVLGHDFTLIDSAESKKNYAFKMSHPNKATLHFATNSRQAVGKWIEMLALAATGQNILAPYPPYFKPAVAKARSRESLASSEGMQSEGSSGDPPPILPRDYPLDSGTQNSRECARMEEDMCTTDQHDGKGNSRTREGLGSPSSSLERGNASSTSYSAAKDRVLKRRKEKQAEENSGRETPSTMSPPHSLYIGENADGGAHPEPNDEHAGPVYENLPKVSQDDSLVGKKDRSWVEALKKKPGKLVRGYTSIGFETSKKFPSSVRKKGDQGYGHLLTLFDKEGRFCGYLIEVKASKFSTTHVRRWCVVKNGVLHMYHGQMDDKAEASLSLVDMWLTDESNADKTKRAFKLHEKDGRTFLFQANGKDDFERWMGVLQLFTALRLERRLSMEKEPLRKADSSGAEEVEHYFERGTVRSKSTRVGNRTKDEGSPPGKPKASLRAKLSHRVNVKDIFKKGHNFYDMENLPAEGSYVNTVGYHSGTLTEVTDVAGLRGKTRWCAVREKELLVYSDGKAPDPLRRFPLRNSRIENVTKPEFSWHWFQVRCGLDTIILATRYQADFDKWMRILFAAQEECSSVEENATCVGKLPSAGLGGILHKRTKSETLTQRLVSSPSTGCYTPADERVSSVSMTTQAPEATDVLISGFLHEMLGGARLSRWCVVTSERFSVYGDKDSGEAKIDWPLVDITIKQGGPDGDGRQNFVLYHGNQVKRYQHHEPAVLTQWVSVFSRYCRPLSESARVMSAETLPTGRLNENRKSASFGDVKMSPEEESPAREALSEGRASGKKAARKISEDSKLFKRLSRPDLFKAPWKASSEKLNVKMREKSTRRRKDDVDRRYSCGNLFDSEGRFCGHLMEVTASELCMSEVRRWCQLRGDDLYVYDHELASRPRLLLPLVNCKVLDLTELDRAAYRFRLECDGGRHATFRALTRSDFEKWTTVISVKSAVLLDRTQRVRRTRSMFLESNLTARSASSEFSSLAEAEEPKQTDEPTSTKPTHPSLLTFPSVSSDDSVFLRLADSDVTSPLSNHVVADQTSEEPAFLVAEEVSGVERCRASVETSVSDSGTPVAEHFEAVTTPVSEANESYSSENTSEIPTQRVEMTEENATAVSMPTRRADDASMATPTSDISLATSADDVSNPEELARGGVGRSDFESEGLVPSVAVEPVESSVESRTNRGGAGEERDPEGEGVEENKLEELSNLYENFVAFAASLSDWYQGEKHSRSKQVAEALYENIPFVYEELVREREARRELEASGGDENSEENAQNSPSHTPSTVARKFDNLHLQDGTLPTPQPESTSETIGSTREKSEEIGSIRLESEEDCPSRTESGETSTIRKESGEIGPAPEESREDSQALGSIRPYSGMYGEAELEELESVKDRSDTPNSLNDSGRPTPTEQDSETSSVSADYQSVDDSRKGSEVEQKQEEVSAEEETGTGSSDRTPETSDACKGESDANQTNNSVGHVSATDDSCAQTLGGEPLTGSQDGAQEHSDQGSLDTYFGAEESQAEDESAPSEDTNGDAGKRESGEERGLSRSQVDLLKAFKEILELHGAESGDEDTRF